MKSRTLMILAAALTVGLAILACGGGDAATPRPTEPPDKTVTATDGHSQMTVPKDWDEMTDLNDKADIQVGSRSDDLYVIVLTEGRQDFVDFASYDELASSSFLEGIGEAEVTGPTDETINGRPARVYQIDGAVSGINVAYLYATVEGPGYFHQVVMWTTQSKFDVHEPAMRRVLASFREIEP